MAEACVVVESVKTTSDIYSPVSGEIIEVDPTVLDNPALANSEPHSSGWFYKIKICNRAELDAVFTPVDYKRQIGG